MIGVLFFKGEACMYSVHAFNTVYVYLYRTSDDDVLRNSRVWC